MSRLIKIAVALAALGMLVVAAGAGIFLWRDDDPDLLTEAPAITTQAPAATSPAQPQAAATPAGAAAAPAAQAAGAAQALRFVIDQSGSNVKYVVKERLSGLPAEAVGQTKAITGEIFLTPQGLAPGARSQFSVDLRTLQTDESRRDNYVRQNVLRTNQFPNAVFVVESIGGFPTNYVDNTAVDLTMRGTLTIQNVSRPVEWTVNARRAGDTLSAIADLTFNMTDFNITPPDVGIAKAEDGVRLQVTILARQQLG
jgi:polyisoprenoid-binding protein YceI